MIGFVLNIDQKNQLVGVQFMPDQYYNPVQDANGDWFIFQYEVDNTTNPEFMWVHSLPQKEFIKSK
jgi:hypothetical protein